MLELNASDFGCLPNSGADATPGANRLMALAAAEAGRPVRVVFSKGRYDFYPDRALQHYCTISNNTNGLKSIVFPAFGIRHLEINGSGSLFVFHGIVNPFVMEDCQDVCLRNFSVDWDRPFYTQALIQASNNEFIDLEFDPSFPYEVVNQRLHVFGEGWSSNYLKSSIEFDPVVGGPAYMARDYYEMSNHVRAVALKGSGVRLYGGYDGHRIPKAVGNRPSFGTPRPGNYLVMKNEFSRNAPGIVIKACRDVTVEDVVLFHSCGMGLIAEKSRDILVHRVHSRIPPGSGRMVSVNADSVHFVNCAGRIVVEGCHFEDQLDDALNIHGNYGFVTGRTDAHTLEIGLLHFEQTGFDLCGEGDLLEFHHRDSLRILDEARVVGVDQIDESHCRVRLDSAVGDRIGDTPCVVENVSWCADLTVKDCRAVRNRGRGCLLKSRGRIRISGNTFSTGGSAIVMEGKTSGFCESGPVRDVLIEDNDFVDCKRGPWGRAVIDVRPMLTVDPQAPYFHRNVTIRGNRFRTFDPGILFACCLDGLEIADNHIERTDTFPKKEESMPVIFALHRIRGARIGGNIGIGEAGETPWLMDEETRGTAEIGENGLGPLQVERRTLVSIGLTEEIHAPP